MKRHSIACIISGIAAVCFFCMTACEKAGFTQGHEAWDDTPSVHGEHVFSEWSVTKEPTCTEEGEKSRFCACGWAEFDTIPALGHDYSGEVTVKEATCEEDGERTVACARGCGTLKTETIPALGHKWETESVIKEPTCTEEGEKVTDRCERCGSGGRNLPIPAKGHSFGEPSVTEAKCTETGLSVRVCEVCGFKEETVVPAKGHSFGEPVVTEAKCTETGLSVRECGACGLREETVIPATGHTFGKPETDEHGVLIRKCEKCGMTEVLGETLQYTVSVVAADGCDFRMGENNQIILYEYDGVAWRVYKLLPARETQTVELPRNKYTVRVDALSEAYLQTEGSMDADHPAAAIEVRANPDFDTEIEGPVGVGQKMFDFLVKDTQKSDRSEYERLSALMKGKELVYIDFYFVACMACNYLLEDYVQFYNSLPTEVQNKILVIMVDVEYDTVSNINGHRERYNVPKEFITMADGKRVYNNVENIKLLPYGVFLDADMNIIQETTKCGFRDMVGKCFTY